MKYNPALAIKMNLSNEVKQRNFRHRDLDRKLAGTKEKLVNAMAPLLADIRNKANESWINKMPAVHEIFADKDIRRYSDTLAGACVYAEMLGRNHLKKQNRLHLASVPFKEAIDDMLQRKVIDYEEYKLLDDFEKLKAFSMAKVSNAELLDSIHNSLTDSIAQGVPFKQWKEGIDSVFDKQGVTRLSGNYLENVYRTNTFSSYMAGRVRQIEKDLDIIEYLKYITMEDDRTCEICYPLDGHIDKPLSAFWRKYMPPNHYGCRCDLEIIYKDEASRVPATQKPIIVEPMKGFGGSPMNEVIPESIMSRAAQFGIDINYRLLKELLNKLNNYQKQ